MTDSSDGYRPTSLGFINRPNPVEPQSVPHNNPLNNNSQNPDHDLFRLHHLLGNPSTYNPQQGLERPSKRRRIPQSSANSAHGRRTDNGADSVARATNHGQQSLDLPRLPVRQSAKRLRIPPTLSGLHQPPPNAGLLPSISVEKPAAQPVVSEEHRDETLHTTRVSTGKQSNSAETQTKTYDITEKEVKQKSKRNKWTDEETAFLLKGVSRFGIGAWTKILKCPDYQFERRTAIDLKDRFRVCCPDNYKRTKKASSNAVPSPMPTPGNTNDAPSKTSTDASPPAIASSRRSDRKTATELQSLGITTPFEKTKRRSRHGYSETEDAALLKGFEKHGNSWADIRLDVELQLSHRRATDLRDRMRTRYPEEYKNAGLAPRPGVFPKPAKRGDEETEADGKRQETSKELANDNAENGSEASRARQSRPRSNGLESAHSRPQTRIQTTSQPTPVNHRSLFNPYAHISAPFAHHSSNLDAETATDEDLFFFGPSTFDHEGSLDDSGLREERITLDRGILDWAGADVTSRAVNGGETGRHVISSGTNTGVNGGTGINPLITLMKLPRPGAGAMHLQQTQVASHSAHSHQHRPPSNGNPSINLSSSANPVSSATLMKNSSRDARRAALPSLASVTANRSLNDHQESAQLELPELVGLNYPGYAGYSGYGANTGPPGFAGQGAQTGSMGFPHYTGYAGYANFAAALENDGRSSGGAQSNILGLDELLR